MGYEVLGDNDSLVKSDSSFNGDLCPWVLPISLILLLVYELFSHCFSFLLMQLYVDFTFSIRLVWRLPRLDLWWDYCQVVKACKSCIGTLFAHMLFSKSCTWSLYLHICYKTTWRWVKREKKNKQKINKLFVNIFPFGRDYYHV